jgi:hypothetical protein
MLEHLSTEDLRLLPVYLQECVSIAPCRIKDVVSASFVHRFQCFAFDPAPFLRVELVACVVSFAIRETEKVKETLLLLDDGTGVIETRTDSSNGATEFWPGDVVKVKGTIETWFKTRHILTSEISGFRRLCVCYARLTTPNQLFWRTTMPNQIIF